MTAENLTRHANDPNAPFWEMLKAGNDTFSAEGMPPKVAVCNQRYVFNPLHLGARIWIQVLLANAANALLAGSRGPASQSPTN